MKDYHECEKVFVGSSDIATIICVGCHNDRPLSADPVVFGGDGFYSAYLADEETEIGKHYMLEQTYNHWLKVYDDDRKTFEVYADEIKVYRAGMRGMIIQVFGKRD